MSETFICKYCNKESKVVTLWVDDMMIEGSLYHIENSTCEHCEEVNNIQKVKLT